MITEGLNPTRPQLERSPLTISLGDQWQRLALTAILGLAGILDFWGLSREGYGNAYYAAAVKSMLGSWHNFFFNAFDPGAFVTIDKPPLGFWLQVASARIFGFTGVSILLPQALAGVLAVALLYYLVTRHFGRAAGLIAALALALTPISVVTSRNNTVDSTLVLVSLLGAWAVLRAAESGKLRWLVLSAVFVGMGFNIKMLEAYLVVPAFGLMYLLGARLGILRRVGYLALAAIVMVVVSLSWVLAVDLTPAADRPWVGSTSTNSAVDLAIGYNGLQRLTGDRSVGASRGRTGPGLGVNRGGFGGPGGNGGPGGVGENGPVGPLRLLDTQLGSQIGWLLPLAVLGFFVGIWRTGFRFQAPEDQQRSVVLWGMWLLTMDVFFSIAGFYHTYYLVMIAPAIAALSGICLTSLWSIYRQPGSKTWWLLPLTLVGGAAVQLHILTDYPPYARWLSPLIAALCLLGAVALVVARILPSGGRTLALPAATGAAMALLAAPAVWAADTVSQTDTGAILHAGPPTATGRRDFGGPPGAFRGRRNTGRFGAFTPPPGGFGPPPGGNSFGPPGVVGGVPGGFGGRGGPGGAVRTDPALVRFLQQHRGRARFLVAVSSAGSAESLILTTGLPVMALGGFTGSDAILTNAHLARLVKAGTVRYFMLGGAAPGLFGGTSSNSSWVQAHCSPVPPSKYSSAQSSSSAGTARFDRGGSLYDCGGVT